jgi:sialidase-1
MKNLFLYAFLFSFVLLMNNCSVKQIQGKDDNFSVTVHAPIIPVLSGKENNPVFRINIQSKGEENVDLQELLIDLKGTTDLKDITKATVFYTAGQEAFAAENVFAQTSGISGTMKLSGRQMLRDSNNYFWLSLTLKDNADLDHQINAAITRAVVNKKRITVPATEAPSMKRIGYALRKHLDDGVHTYRIPGLATTNNGTLIAVYDIRRNSSVDLQEDIDIGMSRSTDGGQSWEPMKIIMDMGEWGGKPEIENGIGDPSVLVDAENNTIWVAGIWAHGHPGKRNWFASGKGLKPEQTSQFILVKSEDDGLTWSEPINITSQIKHPDWHLLLQGPGKGITMHDGTLVFPAQFKNENEVPHSTLIYSKDHGISWQIGTGAKSNTTEAQVVELADHSLMLNMRDDRGNGPNGRTGTGARSVAITKDLGETWTEHPTSRKALPEPVCMASLIKHTYQGKYLLLFSNPADVYVRHNMTIKVSEDDGMTWDEKYHTLIDAGRGFGYSCMTSIDENTIGILYEGSQAHMVFQRIKLSDLYDGN